MLELGQEFLERRLQLGYSQQHVAQAVHISRFRYGRIERGQLAAIRPFFWQTDTSISKNSWGYVKEQDYKTADSVIDDLVDIVSKNGALLLNVGPRPDGTMPAGISTSSGWSPRGRCWEASSRAM